MTVPSHDLCSIEVLKRGKVTLSSDYYYWSNRWYVKADTPEILEVLGKAYADLEMRGVYNAYEVVSLRLALSGQDNAEGRVVAYSKAGELLPADYSTPIIYQGVRMRLYVGGALVGYRVIRNGCIDIWHTGGVWHEDYLSYLESGLVYSMVYSTFPCYTADGRRLTTVVVDRNLAQWPIRHGTVRASRTYWA